MSMRRRRPLTALAIAALGIAALSACGTSTAAPTAESGGTSRTPSASPSPNPTGFPVKFSTTVSSKYSKLATVGPNDDKTYGVSVMEGTTTINKQPVRIRMIGSVDYKDSGGPLTGFLELNWPDGTTLALRQEIQASYDSSPNQTSYEGKLEVVGADNKATGTSGTGDLTGSRAGKTRTVTGGSIKINVSLDLTNAPTSMTGDSRSSGSGKPRETYAATIAP